MKDFNGCDRSRRQVDNNSFNPPIIAVVLPDNPETDWFGMIFKETKLKGAFVIDVQRFEDERGSFACS